MEASAGVNFMYLSKCCASAKVLCDTGVKDTLGFIDALVFVCCAGRYKST